MQECLFCSHIFPCLNILCGDGSGYLYKAMHHFSSRIRTGHNILTTMSKQVHRLFSFLCSTQSLLPSYHHFLPNLEVSEWWITISLAWYFIIRPGYWKNADSKQLSKAKSVQKHTSLLPQITSQCRLVHNQNPHRWEKGVASFETKLKGKPHKNIGLILNAQGENKIPRHWEQFLTSKQIGTS